MGQEEPRDGRGDRGLILRSAIGSVAVASLAVIASFGPTGEASAQTTPSDSTMVIRFVKSAEPLALVPRAGVHGRLAVFVDEIHCTTVIFLADEEKLELGTPEQPNACRQPGGRITFMNGLDRELFESPSFEPGATLDLINLAPQPPGSQLPAYMQVVLDAGWPSPGAAPPSTGQLGLASSSAAPRAQLAFALLTLLALAIVRSRVEERRDHVPSP